MLSVVRTLSTIQASMRLYKNQRSVQRLTPLVNLLRLKRLKMLRRFSYLNPVSAFPVIYYIQAKVLEVQNLRLLVRGKAAGLSDEVIEAHLYI